MKKFLIALCMISVFNIANAKTEVNFETKEQCNEVWSLFYLDKSGADRVDHWGKSYFVQNGKVGHFKRGCYDHSSMNGTFVVESLEEFNTRMDGKVTIREVSTAENLGKVAVGVAQLFLVANAGRAAFEALGAGTGCSFSWQTAKDGSICGLRAANVRPSGQ